MAGDHFAAILVPFFAATDTEDPCNQNRRTSFTIESYATLLSRNSSSSTYGRSITPSYYAIRSEIDGVERELPECLGYLWRTNLIKEEALPRLLKEMQPMLKRRDFRSVWLTKKYT